MPTNKSVYRNRRTILKATSVVILGGLAGCGGNGDGGDGGDGSDGGDGGDGGDGSDGGDGGDGGDFPSQEIEWIIPYSTGGGFDAYSRTVADHMPEHLPNEVEVVPVNRPGAGGQTGATQLFRAEPNGHTIGVLNIPGMVVVELIEDVDYEMREFTWLGRLASSDYVLITPADSEYQTIDDLQAANQIQFGVLGAGNTGTLNTILLADGLGIEVDFVTGYEATPETVAAALRGDVDMPQLIVYDSARSYMEEEDLSVILATGEEPPDFAPDTPLLADEGYEDLASSIDFQRPVAAPPGLDESRREILEDALEQTLMSDELQEWSEEAGRPINWAGGEETAEIVDGMYDALEPALPLIKEYWT